MASDRRASARGASILDVIMAMAILASLLAIGVPRLSRLRAPWVMSSTTRQVAATLYAARMRAIARNAQYRVNFNANTYKLQRNQGGVWIDDGNTLRLPTGVTMGTVSPSNPVFDPRGMLTPQTTVTVPISMTGYTTRTVTTNVLGKVTIQ